MTATARSRRPKRTAFGVLPQHFGLPTILLQGRPHVYPNRMAHVPHPHLFMEQLAAALGLQDRCVRRIVLDCEIGSSPTLYVEEFLDNKAAVEVVNLLTGERERHEDKVLNVDKQPPFFVSLERP